MLVEDLLDHPEALRDQDGAERALDRARGDQHAGRDRDGAQCGCGGEADDPDHEQAPAADQVAEAGAGDQQDREGQRVGGDEPLHRRVAAADLCADRGRRDVDDRAVDEVHHLGHEDDRQHGPAG